MEAYYTKLWSYKVELQKVDKEGKFELLTEANGTNGSPIFKRFYIEFSNLRKAVLEGWDADHAYVWMDAF